jgi:hypothetical protein
MERLATQFYDGRLLRCVNLTLSAYELHCAALQLLSAKLDSNCSDAAKSPSAR